MDCCGPLAGSIFRNITSPQDATDVFAAFHAGTTWRLLAERQIGTCDDAKQDTLLADFRELRAKMQQERMFESSKAFYVWKVRGTMALVAIALLS